jgi:hypothetical protein
MFVPVVKQERLDELPATQASNKLAAAMKDVLVPSTQLTNAMRVLIALSRGYCDRAYADVRDVLRSIYGEEPVPELPYILPTCFTGLAGVGKSSLIRCFARLHSHEIQVAVPHHGTLDLRCCWHLRVSSRMGIASLLGPEFRRNDKPAAPFVISQRAACEAAAQGIAAILADEIQFLTQSGANVLVTRLLLELSRVGPPLVYACNFSLIHRLLKRPQEDRDRLLAQPLILWPDVEGDEWTAFVGELLNACTEFSELDLQDASRILYSYSYGLRRTACAILVLAYAAMRERKACRVSSHDLTAAYRSASFSAKRQDVEALHSGALHKDCGRRDLLCPFPDRLPLAQPTTQRTSEKIVSAATSAAIESVLRPEERRLLEQIRDQDGVSIPPRPKRPAASVSNLIGGAAKFRDQSRKPKK